MAILRAEIDAAFKSYEDIKATKASGLKYLHAVALEGMRMFAPLPFPLPRVVPDGGDSVDGFFLPAGVGDFKVPQIDIQIWLKSPKVIVATNPVAASLSTRNFEAPFDFRPERWFEENKEDNLDAAQPFSLGARGCLGRKYEICPTKSIWMPRLIPVSHLV